MSSENEVADLPSGSVLGLPIARLKVASGESRGRADMTRKLYCGNLLWQSSLTLLVSVAVCDLAHV